MREIHDHKSLIAGDASDAIAVFACDEPGAGGACHEYKSQLPAASSWLGESFYVRFQKGPIGELGMNGVGHEVLLAVVIDRLKSFQAGPYSCRENALALTALQEAMHWLQHRTRERVLRNVEGTSEK